MPLQPGEKLGAYEILSTLGKGGMGEVYRAHDSRLKRDVAIKVSTAQFSERFEREAQAIAALNHPHICQLYDVGPNYLVMEYIEGTALKGPLPVDQALKYAAQICDALDAAHKKSITHRDLKPANILLTRQGIKLLDFGLAKLGSSGIGQAAKPPDGDTLTMALTGKNEIVGTLYYMSPEQLQAQGNGQEVDARSDIFSFGLVLYEILTGKRAFQGSSPASVIAAIMERPAPSIATIAPPALDRLLQRCLAKDPDDRWHSARDLKAELEWIASASESVPAAPDGISWRGRFPWITAVCVLAAIEAVTLWAPWRAIQSADRPLVRLDVDLGADVSLPAPFTGGSGVIVSPDGARLVYASGTPVKLFTRRLDQQKADELQGTEGASSPFFASDGLWVGFLARGKLNKISVEGGPIVPLGDDVTAFAGASWGEDGSIVVSHAFDKGLLRITAGGPPAPLLELGSRELALAIPQILPGGNAVLFSAGSAIEVVTLADRHRKKVAPAGQSAHYLATGNGAGYLIYTNKATLFAVPFDLDKLETRGTPVPILDEIAYQPQTLTSQFDVSRTGTLVYRKGSDSTPGTMTIQWIDPAGKKEPFLAKPGAYSDPKLSPDGKRLVLLGSQGGKQDVWIYDQQRDALSHLTSGGTGYTHAIWSTDGQNVVFGALGQGILSIRADGAGQPQVLTQSKNLQFPWSFSPDGKRLAYVERAGAPQIWTLSLEQQGGQGKPATPEPFIKSQFSDQSPMFSPDGRWLAYESNEQGRFEVYVVPFPTPSSGTGRKWQISNSGGSGARWSGHDLLYQSGDQIMAVSYTVKGDLFEPEKPRVWIAKFGGTQWDLARDGKRIAVITPADSAGAAKQDHEVVFLENFFDLLRRRAPIGK
jgi:serine/threonine protein kinase